MKFDDKASHGKAGEFYFAYWICRYFGWPCRLIDIDVGIDAQIELFDDNSHSCGMFIAAQIKTNQTNNPNVQVTLDNLKYWESISDPVILISITLDDGPNIYWQLINDCNITSYIKRAEGNDSKKVTISFTDDNKLTKSDKDIFKELVYLKDAAYLDIKCLEIDKIYHELINRLTVDGDICTNPLMHNADLDWLDEPVSIFNKFLNEFDKVKSLAEKHISISKLSSNYCKTISNRAECVNYMSSYISEMSDLDTDHDNAIGRRWLLSTNNLNIKLKNMLEDVYNF